MHLQPVFRQAEKAGGAVSEQLFAQGLCLPSGSGMSDLDRSRVIDCVKKAFSSR
jgi:pyridoxal phosphate-dependent aminotransferase EpsN